MILNVSNFPLELNQALRGLAPRVFFNANIASIHIMPEKRNIPPEIPLRKKNETIINIAEIIIGV